VSFLTRSMQLQSIVPSRTEADQPLFGKELLTGAALTLLRNSPALTSKIIGLTHGSSII